MPEFNNDIRFHRVALRYQPFRMRAVDASGVLLAFLKSRKIEVEILHADQEPTEIKIQTGKDAEILNEVDLLISLGGDGTFLSSSRLAAPKGIPVFGVHLGGLGFLTEVTLDGALKGLERVLTGDFYIEERLMIETGINLDGEIRIQTALNDIVIHRLSLSKMVQLEVLIDEHPVVSYEADGIIVATPTGSTAYSLSVGGSILWPDLNALIITPISPHTLTSRPLILPADKIIEVHCPTAYKSPISVTIDGQQSCQFSYPIALSIRKSDMTAKLVRIGKKRFGQILREKLNWGRTYR
jgi:NAD+ kinase